MKSMTCRQLGGACDMVFRANTFEEMAELSKQHGMQMFQEQDEAHLKAMEEMKSLMQDKDAFKQWYASKKQTFELLDEED